MHTQTRLTSFAADRGFIALMATITIGAMMLLLTAALARSGYGVRMQVVGMEQKTMSRSVAERCVAIALMNRLKDREYGAGISLSNDEGTCDIAPLVYDESSRLLTIRAQGKVAHSYTTLEYVYDLQDIYQGTVPLDPGVIGDPPRLFPLQVSRQELSAMP
jgi:hypothetical protein